MQSRQHGKGCYMVFLGTIVIFLSNAHSRKPIARKLNFAYKLIEYIKLEI